MLCVLCPAVWVCGVVLVVEVWLWVVLLWVCAGVVCLSVVCSVFVFSLMLLWVVLVDSSPLWCWCAVRVDSLLVKHWFWGFVVVGVRGFGLWFSDMAVVSAWTVLYFCFCFCL